MEKWVEEKLKSGKKLCNNCYEERIWVNGHCPDCGHKRIIPYYPNPARKISCLNPAIL